jgi:peptide/nickel transport system permease protein
MKDTFRRLLRHPSAVGGGVIVLAYVLIAVLAPLVAPHDPGRGDLVLRLKPPVWSPGTESGHWLGTDEIGRDTLSRLVYGARVSLAVGFATVGITSTVGLFLGLAAGFQRGWFDDVISRFADWLQSFPLMVFAILLMGVLGPGTRNLIFVLSLKGWVATFRVIRSQVLAEREKTYVEAAWAIGKKPWAIMLGEIAPNVIHTLLVLATINVGTVILSEASLSFLGFGVSPRVPAWGSMVAAGRTHLSVAWWLPVLPGAAILVLVLCLNLLGEGLRDVLDPRLRQ